MANGAARWEGKRQAGISEVRRDGSKTSRMTDTEAAGAEEWACKAFGQPHNHALTGTRGDGGHDFMLGEYEVEVMHLGMLGPDCPRLSGNLIVDPLQPQRHAAIYIVVMGCALMGWNFCGWTTDLELKDLPLRDFGYGPRHAMPVLSLHPIGKLLSWRQQEGKHASV